MKETTHKERYDSKILAEGVYENIHYFIISMRNGRNLTAGIEIPKNHWFYNKSYNYIDGFIRMYLRENLVEYSRNGILQDTDPNHRNGFWISWGYDYYERIENRTYSQTDVVNPEWSTDYLLMQIKNIIKKIK